VEEAAPVEISRPKSIKVSRNQKEKEEEQVVQKPQKPNRIQIGEILQSVSLLVFWVLGYLKS